jgi:acyl-CoA reductase-like NAD-dependent aldehyde dehydrogenase
MTSTLPPCPNFIAGEWQTPSRATTPVFNPSTGDVIADRPIR